MKKLQNNQESSMRYVQSSYDEQLHTIQETRKKINAALNTIEQKTLKKMKDTLTKMQASSKSDVNKCIRLRDELKHLRDALEDISDKSSKELSFIATRKCEEKIQKCQTFLREISLQFKVSITFQPNSEILRYLSKLSGLGVIERSAQNQNKLFTVHGTSVQNVGISSDNSSCYITNILILLDGQVLLADSIKKKIKLLDQQYQVVSQWSVITWPLDMCQVTPNEVAVAVAVDDYKTNEVQFITVDNRQLVTGRKLQLEHRCHGIACHHEDLYITANTALYKYTLSGKLVNKMYEDTSDRFTVGVCAVSPMGDKLYITNRSQNKLITLARDGSVLAVFIDPALKGQLGIHVTPAGQVLVCGSLSSTIVQMDSEGNRKLATLLPRKDILVFPRSVCYNSFTASIMVGLREDNKILVLKVK